MEESSAGFDAQDTLTTEEEIYCHKARIFSVLTKAPVVRAWRSAICDGAVYLGKGPPGLHPMSYADRYFRTSREDISYVTFSIVTAFKETTFDHEGREIERSQCHISTAQREASEFLIVTFSSDHDRIALLPHRLYWPVEDDGSAGKEKPLFDEISASTLSSYCFSINFLVANIEEVKRITANPMHPTTTPFQIALDGLIPKAGFPEAIMPQASEQRVEELLSEKALRAIHSRFLIQSPFMKADFLDYQPLLRDFKIVIPSSESFPNGLEAIIGHTYGRSTNSDDKGNSDYLRYTDYLLTHGIMLSSDHDFDYAFFIPCRLIDESWFAAPRPDKHMPKQLRDCGRPVSHTDFIFEMDDAGEWIKCIWEIISKYPPDEHPTPAEKKQDIWKKAFPWPELEAQVAPPKDLTPRKARGDEAQLSPKRDSGTGDNSAVKPSDVSLLADHYMQKASMNDNEGEEEAA